jgi:asparagine synthetase B (glutamine-hydrolysing)
MPGLIAAFGDPAAERTVRDAARPLLRRPWHAAQTFSSAPDELALAFVGERGGLAREPAAGAVVALDGELVLDDRVCSGPDAARRLAELYSGPSPPDEPPDGSFSACVWNPADRSLRLIADRVGHRPIYVAPRGDGYLVASELKALPAAGLEPELDVAAAAELLAYEYVLGDRTLLEGVRLVPPASVLTLRRGRRETLTEWWRYRLDPDDSEPEETLVDEFARLLRQSVHRRVDPSTALSLSGGLDSRAIATALLTDFPETLAVTYGAPGSEDLVLGTKTAESAGLRHRRLPLEPGYLARGAEATVWLAEGHVRCLHSHHLELARLREEEHVHSLLIGFLGDGLVRGGDFPVPEGGEPALAAQLHSLLVAVPDETLDALVTPSFAASLHGLARESLARHLALEEGTPPARRRQFVWRHEARRKVVPGALLFADDLAARDPFADRDLIDFCRRMPDRARLHGRLQAAYLRRFPDLARIRSPKYGIAPARAAGWEQLALRLVAERRRGRSFLDRTLGPRWWADRRGIGDYATDLRRSGADLLAILLEPRTLERGQVREAGVRRLVDDLLRGRARHTRPLGLLLTLELFQRLFVDGEPPVAIEDGPDADARYETGVSGPGR